VNLDKVKSINLERREYELIAVVIPVDHIFVDGISVVKERHTKDIVIEANSKTDRRLKKLKSSIRPDI
jgi:hypothetical protein